jgi:hypothetical protein
LLKKIAVALQKSFGSGPEKLVLLVWDKIQLVIQHHKRV